MDFYYKADLNIAYVTTTKNGSTLMSNLSKADSSLEYKDVSEAIQIIIRNKTKIYAPFRHPYARFISGLEVNFFNNTDFFDGIEKTENFPDKNACKLYKNFVRYLDRSMYSPGTSIGSYYYRPYHLFDQHLDHWLIIPFVLALYNVDIEMVPMHHLTDHLLRMFPKCREHITKSERKGSFDQPQQHLIPLWDAYKSIMFKPAVRFKPAMMEYITFEKWLEPEIRVFNLFNTKLTTTTLNYEVNKIFEKVAQNGDYFYDLWSPRNQQMYKVIKSLHEYVKPLDFFLTLEQNTSQFIWAMERNQKTYNEQLALINRSVTQNTLPKPGLDVL